MSYSLFSLLFAFSCMHAAASDKILIRRVVLEGVTKLPVRERQRIIREIRQHVHSNSDIDEAAERVRFDFQRYGFYRVFVEDPIVRVVARSGAQKIVDLVMDVQEGEQYRLKEIRFSESHEFSEATLRAEFPISDGDIFNREKIAFGLDALRKLYGNKGYINFAAFAETEEDYERHAIALIIDLDTGGVFHFGKLVVAGEESQPGAREKLLTTWKKYQGQVYAPDALERFLRELHARPQVKPEQIFEVSQDPTMHLVVVRIVLSPGCEVTVGGLCRF